MLPKVLPLGLGHTPSSPVFPRQRCERPFPDLGFCVLASLALYEHRDALRGTPGSVCPKPEPNATELPSCAPISARAPQRRRRRRWWRGEENARRPGPEAHPSPAPHPAARPPQRPAPLRSRARPSCVTKGQAWGGGRVRVAARRSIPKGALGLGGGGQLEKERATMTRATMNIFTLPSFAAPGFRRMKMTRSTTSTSSNNYGGGDGGGGGGGGGGDQPCAWRRRWW